MNEMDVKESFLEVADIWGFDSKVSLNFYYDESNNCRKFWIREKEGKVAFNADFNEDFVLAGVVCDEIVPEIDFSLLREQLGLQKNVTAVKFKHHFSENSFWECVNKKRVATFFDILEKNKLHIHFVRVNNLYYAIVEILDSIANIEEITDFGFDYFHVKSTLYKMLLRKKVELQELMYKYCFPNIDREEIMTFCNELCRLCGNRIDMNPEEKFISGMIERAGKSDELVFLHDNKDYIMQESYIEFYANRIMTFPNSRHIFDQEDEIQKRWDDYALIKDYHNYEFVDDKNEVLVQLSDVIAGILGKFFTFLNSSDLSEIRDGIKNLNELQVENILRLDRMIIDSDRRNKGFIQSVTAQYEIDKMNAFFEMVRAKKRKL